MNTLKHAATLAEERACESIAKFWVRYHGDLDKWRECLPEILELFELEECPGNLWQADIIDTWKYDHHLTAEDFKRLGGEIEGWIVSYQSLYGRITP